MKYKQPEEGEWVRPNMDGYKMACCDCGLVHILQFRVEDLDTIEFRAFRNNRSTGQMRRHDGVTMRDVEEE